MTVSAEAAPVGCGAWDFDGARVVITGGARGIGFAIADGFSRAGAQVVAIDRDAGALEEAVAKLSGDSGDGRASSVVCDLSDAGAIATAARECATRLGGIDVLVNNAGIGRSASLQESRDDEIDAVLDINLRAMLILTRELLPAISRDGRGAIVNIASQAAKNGYANLTVYSASKAGVLGFTIALARELAPAVRVNAVCPGQVLTDMMKANVEQTSREQSISYEEAHGQWVEPIPMGRFQEPADVANAVLFLASPYAKEITGESMNVSGGLVTW
jgi:NAD(P)-dependent dehydrogenase (short-subunit alcohol dehydrogenase family)